MRGVLENTVQYTGKLTDYKPVSSLKNTDPFFVYNEKFNDPIKQNPSHRVITAHIDKKGEDYRFETAENPIKALRPRDKDDLSVGVDINAANDGKGFIPPSRA